MNVQFRWGFWEYPESSQTWGCRKQRLHYKPVSNPSQGIARMKTLKTYLPITSKNSASTAAPSNSWQPLKQWRHLRLHHLFSFSGLFSVLLPVTSYLVFPTYLYCIIQDWFDAGFIVHIDIKVLRNRKPFSLSTVFYCSYCARKCTLLMLTYCIQIEDKLFSIYGFCVARRHSNKRIINQKISKCTFLEKVLDTEKNNES